MARLRTIKEVVQHYKKIDPNTAISEWGLRMLVKQNKIKHIRMGTKYLINLDVLEEYFTNGIGHEENGPQSERGIRKVY